MARKCVGLIEAIGLASAIQAADAAVKSGNVSLIGYEYSGYDAHIVVKVEGNVGAVKAAVRAAKLATKQVKGYLSGYEAISEKTGLPLVMHGGSGVSPEDYRTGIANGLRKINYYSYMSKAGTQAVKELLSREDVTFFHDLAPAAEKAMSADAEKAMRVFAGL